MYVTFLKVRVREESRVDMQLFFGFVGLFNIVACLPIGLLLHVIHLERFIVPSSKRAVVGILVNVRHLSSTTDESSADATQLRCVSHYQAITSTFWPC